MSTARDRGDVAGVPDTGIPGRIPRHSGPTALRILVGAHLRRLREARNISREEAGYLIRGSHSKISRLELGRTGFKLRDVADLLTLYGADEAERATLLAMAEQANAPAWWQDYRDVVPYWFEDYLGLERDASLIRTYEIQYVPGLLQTEDYARAVIQQGREREPVEEVERRVQVRMRRQQILRSAAPPKVWAVIDEGALRREVAPPETMRAQLEHLATLAELPHVTIQVLTFSSGGPVGGVGPVTVLRFAPAELDDVVYLEQIAGAQYLTRRQDALPYQHLLDQLVLHARPSAATPAILRMLAAAMA
ncbi:helix-turn-helix domain-containing protein [Nonomuraea roseoviolacea]|uniref:Transcriptional regulator with XRE-family HTH domain n=1 Tax=Nonomuraea roseoviolacea subsp. carminata TaxID=160689 RepID=A0ABT1KAX1_9ACTN|nr:helix-turn-helix transcriptional regulator [Nonomuraea roseoviolacea]MCP2351167.1 transcriptional regulator with XRE-family HTH domain [Nonomuraea roseoviolacea subsp. carminata]